MKTNFLRLMVLVLMYFSGTRGEASLVQSTDARFGANSLTLDTETGLSWLDLTASVNISYRQGVDATLPGGLFEGYRFATAAEVFSLMSHAGLPSNTNWFPTSSPVNNLFNLVGATSFPGGIPETFGITATAPSAGSQLVVGFDQLSRMIGSETVTGYSVVGLPGTTILTYGEDTHFPSVGLWLVTPVPEPKAWLIGAVAVAISFLRARTRGRRFRW